MPPAVSVIIPARDAAGTLTAALTALGAQRHAPAFEVVVVDDGSSDATAAVGAEHGARVVRTAGEGPARPATPVYALRADRLGGFESWLAPRRGIELGEDVWLGWGARRAGARTAFAEGAVVNHAVHQRRAAGFVAEQTRRRFFPALVHRILGPGVL